MQDASLWLGDCTACLAIVSAVLSPHSVIISNWRIGVWNGFQPRSQRLPSVRERNNLKPQWGLPWGDTDVFFFCLGGNTDVEAVYCETMVDKDVISESVYLCGLVISYNPLGLFKHRQPIIQLLSGLHPITLPPKKRYWALTLPI